LLLAVNQLEEVFTQAEAEERDALVQNLLAAASPEGGRVTVVTALRADFLGRALEHSRELAEAVKTSGTLLMPMAEEELWGAARGYFQRSLEIAEALVAADPESAQAKRNLSVSLERLAKVALTMGEPGSTSTAPSSSPKPRPTLIPRIPTCGGPSCSSTSRPWASRSKRTTTTLSVTTAKQSRRSSLPSTLADFSAATPRSSASAS
jgi:hypothetical protein